eukprot:CAMPEP_0182427350 /NCGR_PEP_ID=MMETSP1167-20130531/17107_1 /TAXON_ID=2988 /ORGANISM="Mallomonas Sp, Strain CCMP3275" /LENGTH=158 /DNA_ID=CAMNT_0024609529 /DNA_START=170 /DNA_END=646 /DNA_ORIENTATION=-
MSGSDEGELTLKAKLFADMKTAMKSKQKVRLAAIRAIQTAIKQKEVDDRVDVSESDAIEIMSKIIKQRKESIKSYSDAGRTELVAAEEEEVKEIQAYLPQQLDATQLEAIISETVTRLEAKSVKDMGKVMADVRPRVLGKADMGEVGGMIKKKLTSQS